MISIIFMALAAICNSIMDITTHHFNKSIFSGLSELFWDPRVSWKNKYVFKDGVNIRRKKFIGVNIHPAFLDGWHMCKSLMIIFVVLSIVTFRVNALDQSPLNFLESLGAIVFYGLTWNLTFSVFYNKILRN